jgi:hypothetical protein
MPRRAPLLLLLLALPATADEPIGWRLRRGDTLRYRLENSYRFWTAGRRDGTVESDRDPDRQAAGSGKFEEMFWMKIDVLDVTGDGDAKMKVTFPRVSAHARLDDTGEEAEWDSQSDKPPAEYGFGPHAALRKTEFEAVVRANGELSGLKGSNDYQMAGRTKVFKEKREKTRPEKASEQMPMPLPVDFWLDQIFSTIPPDGVAREFKRMLHELWEVESDYEAEFDSVRDLEGLRCAMHRFEKKDRRIEEKKEGRLPSDFVAPDFRSGDHIKAILASARREIRSFWSPLHDATVLVEGEAHDDRFQDGPVAREQKWKVVLEEKKAAK